MYITIKQQITIVTTPARCKNDREEFGGEGWEVGSGEGEDGSSGGWSLQWLLWGDRSCKHQVSWGVVRFAFDAASMCFI